MKKHSDFLDREVFRLISVAVVVGIAYAFKGDMDTVSNIIRLALALTA